MTTLNKIFFLDKDSVIVMSKYSGSVIGFKNGIRLEFRKKLEDRCFMSLTSESNSKLPQFIFNLCEPIYDECYKIHLLDEQYPNPNTSPSPSPNPDKSMSYAVGWRSKTQH